MFEDALRFPWHGEHNVETLLIGGLLTLLGVLVVPLLFVYGYLVRVVRRTSTGETDAPPAFGDWADLLVDGFVAFLVSVVYFAVPTLVVAIGAVFVFVPVTIAGSGAADPAGGFLAVGGALLALALGSVSLLLVLVASYLVPAAVAVYARTGRFGAAFSPSRLGPVATDRRYGTGWLVAVAIGALAQVLASVVGASGVGFLLVPFVLFYGSVAGAYAIGVGVEDQPFDGGVGEESPESRAAV